jgi:2-methylcitrate dehydratase PrpD
LDAKFSVQYVLARALIHGQVKIEHFDPGAHEDAETRAVMTRVSAEPYPSPADNTDEHFNVELTVTTISGEVHTLALLEPVGRSSKSPLPPGTLRDKFNDCAGRLLAADKAAELGDAVEVLETLDDIRALTMIIGDAEPSAETKAPASRSAAVG